MLSPEKDTMRTECDLKKPCLKGPWRNIMKTWRILVAAFLLVWCANCATPADRQDKKSDEKTRHVHKELKPEIYEMPQGVKQALPGLQNDKIYIYREVAPLFGLVSYEEDYDRTRAVKQAAEAFLALLADPALQKDMEFWIIQVQPAKEDAKDKSQGKSRVVVWGVRPSEVEEYRKSGDLANFVRSSEYMLVDDEIIDKGDERLELFPGLKKETAPPKSPAESPKQEEGNTLSETE